MICSFKPVAYFRNQIQPTKSKKLGQVKINPPRMPYKLSQVGIGIADPGTVTMENIEDRQTQLLRLNIVPLLKLTDMRNSVLMGGRHDFFFCIFYRTTNAS